LLEEAFVLTYRIPGLTVADVEAMSVADREWWLKRLNKQIKTENKATKGK